MASKPQSQSQSPSQSSQTQRRKYERVAIRMSAEVRIEGDDRPLTATTLDLAEGGVGLELDRAIGEGTLLTLGLFLVIDDVEEEKVPPLWVKGRTAWVSENDAGRHVAGVRFEVITAEQKRWIRQVLEHLSPKSPAAG